MGLLDDAIREHLDLKRRRGGDPTEIERSEREALGPVRRNREPAGGPAAGDPDPTPGGAWEEPDEGVAADLVDARAGTRADRGPDGPSTIESPVEETWSFDEDPAPVDPDIREAGAGIVSTAGQETTEFSLEDALAAEEAESAEAEADEDVLEETPDFLQDTPDHDRLWFEQRPPRDFDFDG